ncbi:MAG: hypothetical protein ABF289_04720 [Clostridiales bacterium]
MKKINDEKIININGLINEDKCYQKVRELRWSKKENVLGVIQIIL